MNNTAIFLSAILVLPQITGCVPLIKAPDVDQPAVTSESSVWYPVTKDSIDVQTKADRDRIQVIDGKTYYLDKDDNLVLTKGELLDLEKSGVKVFHPHPITGVEVSSEELGALMQDGDALFAYLKNPNYLEPGQVSFVVNTGSLRDNLSRLAQKHNIKHFRWEVDFDYHLPEQKVITANNFNELLATLTRGFPVEASIEDSSSLASVMRVYDTGENASRISFVVSEGSLKDNFIRLSREAGWEEEWLFNHDFHVPETQVIRGKSFKEVLTKMLKIQQYPILAESDNQ